MDCSHSTLLRVLCFFSVAINAFGQRDFGVDVSHYQATTGISQSAWNQMYSEGKRFAFIKATEGLTGPDDTPMATNVVRATAAGLRAGVYHYAHPENRPTTNGAVQEADHFLSFAGTAIGPGYLRPVIDVEGSAATLSSTALTDWIIAFSNELVAQRGSNAVPIIYCSQDFANNAFDSRLASYDLWLRVISTTNNLASDNPPKNGYPSTYGVFTNWAFWQYSATGTAGGISPIDLNVCHSDYKSLDSYLVPGTSPQNAPQITTQPQNILVVSGDYATFSVAASGTPPLRYQWRFGGTDIVGATSSVFTRTDTQLSDAGLYSVVVTNTAGTAISSAASLVVVTQQVLFSDSFDNLGAPLTATSPGTVDGYNILFGAASGPMDFTAIFGFDYSSVTFPKSIPPAPHSSGTTKGLYVTVNKDTTAAAAAVNLYPISQIFTGNFALKFDMWINWTNIASSTEHALFGINHSGNMTNRIGQAVSDGVFFAVDGDGNATATSTTIRDYSIFTGTTNGIPLLLTTNNTQFGPKPLLGAQFDNNNSGFASLFPSKTISGYPSTPTGSAGLEWVRAEVRQENNLVTWLLNETVIAQFTNVSRFTNGTILIGYNDNFASVGDANNYVIFDNVRVERLNVDSDGDGLPDQWEVQYFGHLGVDPAADSDGDGISNLNEYVAGTNPKDANSFFRVVNTTQTPGGFQLDWTVVPGRSYVVQFAGDLSSPFSDVSPVLAVTGSADSTTNYVHSALNGNAGFYRIKILP